MTRFNHWLSQRPRLTIVFAMIFWGASFPAMKFSITQMDPMFVVFSRMLLGSICLLPVLRFLPPVNFRKNDVWWILALVVFEPCLYFYFEIRALQLTSATQAGFIAATLPLLVILSSALILRETIRVRSILGMLIAFCGMAVMTIGSDNDLSAPNPLIGNLFELLAMFSATGFTLILKFLTDRFHPILLTFFQTLAGTVFYAFTLFNRNPFAALFSNPQAMAVILFLGIIVTVLAYVFYIGGIQRIPANEAILFVNLIPVFGMVLSFLFLGERINMLQGFACILVITGIMVGQKRQPVIELNAA